MRTECLGGSVVTGAVETELDMQASSGTCADFSVSIFGLRSALRLASTRWVLPYHAIGTETEKSRHPCIYYNVRRVYYTMRFLCKWTRQGHVGERGLCSSQRFITKPQAVGATVPKTPLTTGTANSDVSGKLAARRAGCADPERRAKRWLRCDEAVAWRNIVSSGTASLASAPTNACPCARWITDSSQESSR